MRVGLVRFYGFLGPFGYIQQRNSQFCVKSNSFSPNITGIQTVRTTERPNTCFAFGVKIPGVMRMLRGDLMSASTARLRSMFHRPRKRARQISLSLANRHHFLETSRHARRTRSASCASESGSRLLLPVNELAVPDRGTRVRTCKANSGGSIDRISGFTC